MKCEENGNNSLGRSQKKKIIEKIFFFLRRFDCSNELVRWLILSSPVCNVYKLLPPLRQLCQFEHTNKPSGYKKIQTTDLQLALSGSIEEVDKKYKKCTCVADNG